jgi:hypothetical protein
MWCGCYSNIVYFAEKDKLMDEIQALREIVSNHTLDDNGAIEFVMSSTSNKLYLKCIETILRRSERGSDPKNRYRATQLDILDLVALLDESLISLQSSIVLEDIENTALTGLLSHLSGSQKHVIMNLLIAMPTQEFARGPKNPFIDMSPPSNQPRPSTLQLPTSSSSWRRPSRARIETGDAVPSSFSKDPSPSAFQARRLPPPSPRSQSSPGASFERSGSAGDHYDNITPFDASPTHAYQSYNAEADIFSDPSPMNRPSPAPKADIREQNTLSELESFAYNPETNEAIENRNNKPSQSQSDSSMSMRGDDQVVPNMIAAPPKRRVSMNPFSNLLYELNPELYEQQKRQETEAASQMGYKNNDSGTGNLKGSASSSSPSGAASGGHAEWTPVLDASSGSIYYFNRTTM